MPHTKITADLQRFLVHNPKEILRIFNDFLKGKSTLSVSFNQGAEGFLTTIIAVDETKHLAYLDLGRDDTFNARLAASHDVTFTYHEGIETRWTSAHPKIVMLKDGKALCIGFPHDLLRIQRREFHRLATPSRTPVICRAPVPSPAGTEPAEESYLELTLQDISVGGIGIIVTGPLDSRLSTGAVFNNCKIDLPDVGSTNLTLEVKWCKPIPTTDETIKHRLGMEFINPSRGNQALIQKYTFILESASLTQLAP